MLRKLCIFAPSQPLTIKTKFYNSDNDDLFLEVQIKNISPSTVFLQKVSLELPEMYTVEALNILDMDGIDECTFGTRTFLQAREGRHYLYQLRIKEQHLEKVKTLNGLTEMGELEIIWKKELGEMAMLITVPLTREVRNCGALKLISEKIPHIVTLEEPFQIICKVTNCTDKIMKLLVKMHDTTCIRWCGRSGSYLGKLMPGASFSFTLTLLCIQLGLRKISGLRVIDTALKTKYRYDDIANVYVVMPSTDKRKH